MAYNTAHYGDVEPAAPGMHFLRDALDAEHLGLTVLDAEAGWSGMEHDHGEEGHEEIYLCLEGAATVTVEGEPVELGPGDAIRIDPADSRTIELTEDSLLVLAGAP